MANALIKHFQRYEYLISNDVITLAKTKVEITLDFSGSLRISINQKKKKMTSTQALEMCKKSIDFQVLSIINTPLGKHFFFVFSFFLFYIISNSDTAFSSSKLNHSAVYILFWSFEIRDNILRNQK